jgi:hypothetical protein
MADLIFGHKLHIVKMYKDKEVKKNVKDIFLSMCERQTSGSHYGSKVSAVTKTVFKYRNKIGKIVVKAVPSEFGNFVINLIGTPYRGKRFLTRQIPTSCLPKSGGIISEH